MVRLGIFVVRDTNGCIDQYVNIWLEAMRSLCNKIIFCVCGDVSPKCITTQITTDVDSMMIYSINTRDDQIIRNVILQEKLADYDELVFINDMCFGPFYPLEYVFDEMEERMLDFWGITSVGKRLARDWTEIPEILQTYFFVVSSSLLHSQVFSKFFAVEERVDQRKQEFSIYFFEI